jgi:hypothetical protein
MNFEDPANDKLFKANSWETRKHDEEELETG